MPFRGLESWFILRLDKAGYLISINGYVLNLVAYLLSVVGDSSG